MEIWVLAKREGAESWGVIYKLASGLVSGGRVLNVPRIAFRGDPCIYFILLLCTLLDLEVSAIGIFP